MILTEENLQEYWKNQMDDFKMRKHEAEVKAGKSQQTFEESPEEEVINICESDKTQGDIGEENISHFFFTPSTPGQTGEIQVELTPKKTLIIEGEDPIQLPSSLSWQDCSQGHWNLADDH